MFPRRPQIADLLTLSVTAQRDVSATRRSLHRRDRDRFLGWKQEIATSGWDPASATPEQRVHRWLRDGETGVLRVRLASATAWSFALAMMLAALLGVGAAMVLFQYDGSRPINVLWVLLVFVALPLFTAGLSAIGMLYGWPRAGWMPGAGVWFWLWQRFAQRTWVNAGTTAEATMRTHAKVLRGALSGHAWWVGQCVGLAFVAAGAATFAVLLATSDLAFGWASTFDMDRSVLADGLASALWFWPALAPDVAMLNATVAERATPFAERYAQDPSAFKAWWRPLLALVLIYGVAPRLALTVVAAFAKSRAITKAFANHPSAADIDARLTTPFIESTDHAHDAKDSHEPELPTIASAPIDSAIPARSDVSRWLRWADAPLPSEAATNEVIAIGGEASLEDDRRALDRLTESVTAGNVRIVVKAWEPPLGEFTDWLVELRQRIGEGRDVDVVAMMRDASDQAKAAVWQRSLSRLADPWLRVYTANVEGDA
ncbi:MAG: DUF2868 domain-containing protein [Planctomycetota bacterium]